jgi:MFS family permease
MTERDLRRRFLVLRATRWLPVGLLVPVLVLLLVERGFTLGQIGFTFAVQGVVVFCLELPTGGLSDTIGRRPVLLAATAIDVAAILVLLLANALPLLVLGWLLQGIYRALESGPLDAWYVDAAHGLEDESDDPNSSPDGSADDDMLASAFAGAGVVTGLAMAVGALVSGALVALDPVAGVSALAVPVVVALALRLVDLVTIFALLREPPRRRSAARRGRARDVATVVSRSTRAIAASTVLATLVAVELFWGFGMTAMELLPAPKLGDVMSDLDAAAALLGPVSTASWIIAALGAAAAPRLATRIGIASGAMVLHAVLAAAILAMALVTGPAGVVTCLLVAFGAHGAINPLYQSLVHRQADAATRTTIVSATSMTAQLGGALGAVMLGAIATGVSIDVAIAVGSLALLATIPLYLPARRQDLGRASELRNAAPVG